MNEKVSFLKFFFESGKFSDSTLTGHIVDLFPAVVYVYDADNGKIRYVNKRFHEFFGRTPSHISDALQIVHPQDMDSVEAALKSLQDLNENESCSYVARLNTGIIGWKSFLTHAFVLHKNADGKPGSVLFISTDVSEEIRHQNETDNFHLIWDDTEELLQFGSWTFSLEDNVMTWTDGLFKLFGYPKSERSLSPSADLLRSHIANDFRETFDTAFARTLTSGEPFEMEFPVRTRNGIQKLVFTKAKLVTDKSNGKRVIGITRDITALRNFQKRTGEKYC